MAQTRKRQQLARQQQQLEQLRRCPQQLPQKQQRLLSANNGPPRVRHRLPAFASQQLNGHSPNQIPRVVIGGSAPSPPRSPVNGGDSTGRLLRRGERRLTRIAMFIVWLFIFCHIWKVRVATSNVVCL